MKILIFIFIFVNEHFLNCLHIPEHLKCADPLCKEIISSGRMVKSVKPVFGNIELFKQSTKIVIKGKNHDKDNTLWLVEQEGKYGFIDMTFIKEIKKDIKMDLSVVRNPYDDKSHVETKSKNDSGESNNSLKDDDTEVFNEESEEESDSDFNSNGKIFKNNPGVKLMNVHEPSENLVNQSSNKQLVNETEKIDSPTENKEIISKDSVSVDNDNLKPPEQLNVGSKSNLAGKTEEVLIKHSVNISHDEKNPVSNSGIELEKLSQPKENDVKIKGPDTIQKKTDYSETFSDKQKVVKSEAKKVKIESKPKETPKATQNDAPIKSGQSKIEIPQPEKSESEKYRLNVSRQLNTVKQESPTVQNGQSVNVVQSSLKSSENNSDIKKTQEKSVTEEIMKPQDTIKLESTEKSHGSKEIPKKEDRITSTEPLNDRDNVKSEIDTNNKNNNQKVEKLQNSEEIQKKEDRIISNESLNDRNNMKSEIDKNHKKVDSESDFNHRKMENNAEQVDQRSEKETSTKTGASKSVLVQKEIVSKPEPKPTFNSIKHIDEINIKTKSIPNDNVNFDVSKTGMKSIEEEQKLNKTELMQEILKEETNTVSVSSKSADNGPVSDSLKSLNGDDPWFDNNAKSGLDNKDLRNMYRSPIIKMIVKLDLFSQFLLKSVTTQLGFDSTSKINQFSNKWLQMSLENLLSILIVFLSLGFFVYTPKIFKFNRDWQGEFRRQTDVVNELESKLQNMEQTRQKLTVQNHNFEKVINDYKQEIVEIQEEAKKNRKTVVLEIEKIKKSHDSVVKALTNDLTNRTHQFELLENDLAQRMIMIDSLEREKRTMETRFEEETSQLEQAVAMIQDQLKKSVNENEELIKSLQLKATENEKLLTDIEELNLDLETKKDLNVQLEKAFENLKSYEQLTEDEFDKRKDMGMELSVTKDQLSRTRTELERLSFELNGKNERIIKLEEFAQELEEKQMASERQRIDAVALQEAAEMKLKVLSDYFKSKEVEMAQTLGHKVIETNQSMEEVDILRHRIQLAETEKEEMSKTINRLKSEIKESQLFAVKCKNEANDQVNSLFLKNSNLERNLILERDENKKLRSRLSHYVGPTPPRTGNQGLVAQTNSKDRPSSRQSMNSESSGYVTSLPQLLPISFLPQTTPQQNSHFSGRNSANSKKSSNA